MPLSFRQRILPTATPPRVSSPSGRGGAPAPGASGSPRQAITAAPAWTAVASESLSQAWDAMRGAPWRAALTIVGVAIGVIVVVLMAAVIRGVNTSVAQDIAAAGPNTFFLYRRPVGFQACDGTEDTCPWLRNPPLTVAEAAALRDLPEIQDVTPHVSTVTTVAVAERRVPDVTVEAYGGDFLVTTGGTILAGRPFSPREGAAGLPVALINPQLVRQVFPNRDPIGAEVRLDGERFRVIGVYEPASSFLGRPGQASGGTDPLVVIPIERVARLGASLRRLDLTVVPREGVPPATAQDAVLATLRSMRGLRPSQANTFELVTQSSLLETYNRLFGTFFLVLLGLSGVGLLVGGVGVVAIMTIAVTERTREIGIRKALGAPRSVIRLQFLVEAVLLTGTGAAAGLLVGTALAWAIGRFSPLPTSVPWWAIAAALGSATITGVVFGLIPAIRASRLDPVEALRWE